MLPCVSLKNSDSISTILDSQAVDEKYSQTLESQSVDKQQTQAQKSHREQLELESTFDKSPNSNSNALFLSLRDTAPAVARQSIKESTQALESTFSHNAPFLSLRALAQDKAWQSNSAPAESSQINGRAQSVQP